MKAVVKTKPGIGLEILDVPDPKIEPGEVIIQIEACGVCGNDARLYRWDEGFFTKIVGPYLPVTIGHEGCGRIVELGAGVEGFKSGQRVVMEATITCGRCYLCLEGKSNICVNSQHIGAHRSGAMAEYIAVPQQLIYPVPDSLRPAEAALLEPLSVGVHGLERMPVKVGNTVAVVGPGAIGLLLVQAARAAGADRIIVLGTSRSQRRLDLARSFGADEVIITDQEDWGRKVADITDGRGVDQAFETAGPGRAVLDALLATRKGGQVCLVGANDDPPQLQTYTMLRGKEIDIFTARGRTPLTWERSLRLVASGCIDFGPLTGDRVPLAEAVAGFERHSTDRDIIKLIVEP